MLQGYNFNIEHRQESENIVGDALSRYVEEVLADPKKMFQTTQFAAEDYQELVQEVKNLKVDKETIFKRRGNPNLSSLKTHVRSWLNG